MNRNSLTYGLLVVLLMLGACAPQATSTPGATAVPPAPASATTALNPTAAVAPPALATATAALNPTATVIPPAPRRQRTRTPRRAAATPLPTGIVSGTLPSTEVITDSAALTRLARLPLSVRITADTVGLFARYLGPQDMIKVYPPALDLLSQVGNQELALHLPQMTDFTSQELLSRVPQSELDRFRFFAISIENHSVPADAVYDPSPFLARVRALADDFHKKLVVAVPMYRYEGHAGIKPDSGVEAARYADVIVVEAQKYVDDPAHFKDVVSRAIAGSRAVNPQVKVWVMVGCSTGRCSDTLNAFVEALAPLADQLDGVYIFYPAANPSLAEGFVEALRR